MAQESGTRHSPQNVHGRDGIVDRLYGEWQNTAAHHSVKYCSLTTSVQTACSSWGAVGPDKTKFMGDSVRSHRTADVSDILESESIEHMEWPVYIPDLNHIEHAWDVLGRRVSQKHHSHRTMQELENAVRREWDNFLQGLFSSLVNSINSRCNCALVSD